MKAEKQHKEPQQADPIQSKQEKTKLSFVDNRPQAASQTKLIQSIQKKDSTNTNLIQRMVQVDVVNDGPKKKKIRAKGQVQDFKDGTTAGDEGWVGVTSYRSFYEISNEEYENKGDIGPLNNYFTTPEAGHVLAKQNGGNGADSDNLFAQDGGTNNSPYKAFENNMHKDLSLYKKNDDVKFTCYLAGNSIRKGKIANEALSDASSISSDDSNSGSAMSECSDSGSVK